jgi:hypothetical protein
MRTKIVDGLREWSDTHHKDNLHNIIVEGLKEAIKSDPMPVENYLVFELDPIIIEVHKELELISLVSGVIPSKDFGYNKWRDLFKHIRTYWFKVYASTTNQEK